MFVSLFAGVCSGGDQPGHLSRGVGASSRAGLFHCGASARVIRVLVAGLLVVAGGGLAWGEDIQPDQSPVQSAVADADAESVSPGDGGQVQVDDDGGPPSLDQVTRLGVDGPAGVEPVLAGAAAPTGGLPAPAGWSVQATAPAMPSAFPWLEHRGYFRFRPYYHHNLDLGTYRSDAAGAWTSGQPPPLSSNQANRDQIPGDDRSKGVYGGDVRFRYEPSLHLNESIKVVGQIDVFDNYLLGSNPDGQFFRLDTPVQALAGGAAPLDYGSSSGWSALRVKSIYVDWSTPVGLFQVGRIPDQWGLGMVYNSGDCLDCDFGDYKDRLSLTVPLFGFYGTAALDMISSGLTDRVFSQPYGRPRDLSILDNVLEYNLMFMKAPLTNGDREARRIRLEVERKKVWEGGVRLSYRHQNYTSQYPLGSGETLAHAQGQVPWQGPRMWDDFQLLPFDYWMFTPDVWGRVEWQPKPGRHYKFELEGAARIGSIGSYRAEVDLEPLQVDIMGFGGVARGTFRNNKLKGGFELGVASGGEPDGFGIYDGPSLPAPLAGSADVNTFFFNRDYRVDLLLFNQVIGTVTNAIYAKPGIGYDFIQNSRDVVGLRGDVIMAMAWDSEQTPGDARLLGLEADVGLHWVRNNSFTTMIKYGILLPFAGLDLPEGTPGFPDGVEASLAHTVQGWMVLGF